MHHSFHKDITFSTQFIIRNVILSRKSA